MTKDTAAWFVQDELPKAVIPGNELCLLANSITRRRGNATNNDITDLAFSMAVDYVDQPG